MTIDKSAPPPPLPDPPLSEEEAFDLFMRAIDEVYYALRVVKASAQRAGFTAGVDAYRQWMDEELKKFQVASTTAPEKMTLIETINRHPADAHGETANDRVLLWIKANPGHRGYRIANEFAAAQPPLPERTVRTALFRLKGEGKIVSVDNRWYAREAAPVRRPPVSIGEPDGPA
jgi:hypothetical protein